LARDRDDGETGGAAGIGNTGKTPGDAGARYRANPKGLVIISGIRVAPAPTFAELP